MARGWPATRRGGWSSVGASVAAAGRGPVKTHARPKYEDESPKKETEFRVKTTNFAKVNFKLGLAPERRVFECWIYDKWLVEIGRSDSRIDVAIRACRTPSFVPAARGCRQSSFWIWKLFLLINHWKYAVLAFAMAT